MWVTMSVILALILLITLIMNSMKDDEIKNLKYKLGYLEGKTDSIGNKRYK
ncbi:DUF1514 family protein [Staphylococcus xylosus]|uniref:DUF1514 family protein n=1 Tax=Staphylococcus xylosus TaxID=1288 RepID=UPI0015FBD3C4|nr:DUF1514 family protein [Staphylococcus xylosus]